MKDRKMMLLTVIIKQILTVSGQWTNWMTQTGMCSATCGMGTVTFSKLRVCKNINENAKQDKPPCKGSDNKTYTLKCQIFCEDLDNFHVVKDLPSSALWGLLCMATAVVGTIVVVCYIIGREEYSTMRRQSVLRSRKDKRCSIKTLESSIEPDSVVQTFSQRLLKLAPAGGHVHMSVTADSESSAKGSQPS